MEYTCVHVRGLSTWTDLVVHCHYTQASLSSHLHPSLYRYLLSRPESGAAAGLVEGNQRRSQESSVPGHPAASAQRDPKIGIQQPECMSDLHHLSESEQITLVNLTPVQFFKYYSYQTKLIYYTFLNSFRFRLRKKMSLGTN